MKRVLLAIGCDFYDYDGLPRLHGAENDAVAFFDHLVTKGWGEYEKGLSRLLKSPTIFEVQQAISEVLFHQESVVEFTFFFAGHGGVKDGAYFLCMKDTRADRLSLTALSMTQIFAWLNEAKVTHTNLIVDACESGGVANDISTLLNPTVIGKAGSLALSILAASGSDEYALEINGSGLCTTALLSCLRGHTVVQTTRPTLDLVEVGKVVSESLGDSHQTPIYWGINLYGRAQFAKNPRYDGGTPHLTEALLSFTPDNAANEYIRGKADKIWGLYLSLNEGFDAERFFEIVEPICSHFTDSETIAASFVEGLANTFGPRIRQYGDLYDEAQLYAASAAVLLKLMEEGNSPDRTARDLTIRTIRCVDDANTALMVKLADDKYALLEKSSGFADLYFLPIRILRVLGWLGAATYAANVIEQPTLISKSVSKDVINFLLNEYSQSIVAVSDEQAPFYIAFSAARDALECVDEIEIVSGLLFSSLCDCRSRISASGLSGDDALIFLNARITGNYSAAGNTLARPTTMLPALILAYNEMGIGDVVDRSISKFDHVTMNLFIPETYRNFCDELIDVGVNYSYEMGHSVWRTSDLVEEWRTIKKRINSDPALNANSMQIAALFASLLRPNREPWFLLR